MLTRSSRQTDLQIRPLQYRDLDAVERLCGEGELDGVSSAPCSMVQQQQPVKLSRWYGLLRSFGWLPHPWRAALSMYVAEFGHRVRGVIRVSPFNHTRSTWRVDQIAVESAIFESKEGVTTVATASDMGTALLRYCLENIWQASTWLLELDVNDQDALGLYRQNGFQLLAQMTYWSFSAQKLREVADREPDLPNLQPVSNADAQLLYQLDNMAMPPLVRQVFDRHPQDFKTSLLQSLVALVRQWVSQTETVSGYVFETQRKVAIGHFQLRLCKDGSQPHQAQLTVHPAYTWLYPELIVQMARIVQDVPEQSLQIVSADYHRSGRNSWRRWGPIGLPIR
ncbi:MAG: GNAT family N-acetyltransferase [Alkalinema sp. RU_4_3]|nr:GNAT family N-acetyltransferase [Alkalinema sp. RU_4_3]